MFGILVLDWLTAPENMILRDQIEVVNRKMLDRMRETTEHLAVMFCKPCKLHSVLGTTFNGTTGLVSETDCKQCEKVVSALEEIDDEVSANYIYILPCKMSTYVPSQFLGRRGTVRLCHLGYVKVV